MVSWGGGASLVYRKSYLFPPLYSPCILYLSTFLAFCFQDKMRIIGRNHVSKRIKETILNSIFYPSLIHLHYCHCLQRPYLLGSKHWTTYVTHIFSSILKMKMSICPHPTHDLIQGCLALKSVLHSLCGAVSWVHD